MDLLLGYLFRLLRKAVDVGSEQVHLVVAEVLLLGRHWTVSPTAHGLLRPGLARAIDPAGGAVLAGRTERGHAFSALAMAARAGFSIVLPARFAIGFAACRQGQPGELLAYEGGT